MTQHEATLGTTFAKNNNMNQHVSNIQQSHQASNIESNGRGDNGVGSAGAQRPGSAGEAGWGYVPLPSAARAVIAVFVPAVILVVFAVTAPMAAF